MNPFFLVLSGFLFAVGGWQLEIVNLRRERRQHYYLPFYIGRKWKPKSYSFWGDVWFGCMVLGYFLGIIGMM